MAGLFTGVTIHLVSQKLHRSVEKLLSLQLGFGMKLPGMEEQIIQKVKEKIKVGVEKYRAASDAPAKVDVYDVIEEVFADLNPNLGDESKISVEEASGCLRRGYLDRKEPAELYTQADDICSNGKGSAERPRETGGRHG